MNWNELDWNIVKKKIARGGGGTSSKNGRISKGEENESRWVSSIKMAAWAVN